VGCVGELSGGKNAKGVGVKLGRRGGGDRGEGVVGGRGGGGGGTLMGGGSGRGSPLKWDF